MAEPAIFGWCFGCGMAVSWGGGGPHFASSEIFGQVPCGPVWPGVRARDQAELEAKVSELFAIEAPGHWLEWVPGCGALDLDDYVLPAHDYPGAPDYTSDCSYGCGAWAGPSRSGGPDGWKPPPGEIDHGFQPCPKAPRIRWLRISADPDGPPVDFIDVWEVVRQARAAGVPVWIERLRCCRELPEGVPDRHVRDHVHDLRW